MKTQFLVFSNPEHYKILTVMENHMNLAMKSKATIKCYINRIFKIIKEFNRLPEECTKNELIDFLLRHKTASGFQYATLKSYVCALRYYFTHIIENTEFALKIPCPKIKSYDIEVLSTKDINCLFNACNDSRQKLIIQILYETGMRLSELANLKFNHIDFKFKSISIINGKNKKSRTIKFGQTLEDTLKKYISDFPSLFSDTLFANKLHPFIPLSPRGIQWNINYISKKTNIKKKISPHILRHTFAVHYLNFGGSIYQLQNILGHANMRTTLHYLQYAVIPECKNISVLDSLGEFE